MDKQKWYIHSMECYSARNEWDVATYYMILKNIFLSKRSQALKSLHGVISFIWNLQKRQILRNRKQISDYLTLMTGVEMGYKQTDGVLRGKDHALKPDHGGGCYTTQSAKYHWGLHLQLIFHWQLNWLSNCQNTHLFVLS